MRKKNKAKIAWVFIALMITIPFYISASLAQADDLNNLGSGNQNYEGIFDYSSQGDLNIEDPGDAAEQCIAKHEETSKLADLMDNDVIALLEKISAIMYLIYTTMTAVHTILSAVSAFFSLEGGCCAGQPYTTSACGSFDNAKNAWDGIYNSPIVAGLGCFVSCGWCTGQGSCGGFFADIPVFKSVPGVMNNARLSPYENIYTASACMCPTAILFNLRKLKAIYESYDCCIEEACSNGVSTQSCEKMLDVSTCMYWKGSLYKMFARIAMGLIVGLVQNMILKVVGKNAVLNCIIAIFDLAQIPGTIQGVQEGFKWVSVSFSEPKCKDLGFDQIVKDVQASKPIYKDVKVYDSNRDGRYDGITKIVSGSEGEVHSTKTNYAEKAMTNNRAILTQTGMMRKVEVLPASGGVDMEQGDIVTIGSTGKSYVVRDTPSDTASKFGYTFKTTDGNKLTLRPTPAEGEISYSDVKVERLSEQAAPSDKKLYNGLGVAIHRYNKYESKEKLYSNEAEIGPDLKKGERAIVQRGEAFIQINKDKKGEINKQEVNVIIDYSSRGGEFRPKIDGEFIDEPVMRTTNAAGEKSEYVVHKGQLYKKEGNSKEWKSSDEPQPIVVQGKTSDATIVSVKEQENLQKRDERAYKAAWMLLDSTLGKYAYSKIDQMCLDEWESSES